MLVGIFSSSSFTSILCLCYHADRTLTTRNLILAGIPLFDSRLNCPPSPHVILILSDIYQFIPYTMPAVVNTKTGQVLTLPVTEMEIFSKKQSIRACIHKCVLQLNFP